MHVCSAPVEGIDRQFRGGISGAACCADGSFPIVPPGAHGGAAQERKPSTARTPEKVQGDESSQGHAACGPCWLPPITLAGVRANALRMIATLASSSARSCGATGKPTEWHPAGPNAAGTMAGGAKGPSCAARRPGTAPWELAVERGHGRSISSGMKTAARARANPNVMTVKSSHVSSAMAPPLPHAASLSLSDTTIRNPSVVKGVRAARAPGGGPEGPRSGATTSPPARPVPDGIQSNRGTFKGPR